MSRRRIGLAAAGALLIAVVVVALRSSASSNKVKTTTAATSNSDVTVSVAPSSKDGATSNGASSGSRAKGSSVAAAAPTGAQSNVAHGAFKEIPLTVSSSQTSGLADGETVNLHVDAKPGQVVYGFDAYQCKGGTTYQYDYDILPSWSGKCVTHPLSPNAQDFVEVASTAPFKSADGTFRVGVGTTSYQTRDGKTAVITCGPHDPCYLVLKLQFQNGYGFEAIPLEFKG